MEGVFSMGENHKGYGRINFHSHEGFKIKIIVMIITELTLVMKAPPCIRYDP